MNARVQAPGRTESRWKPTFHPNRAMPLQRKCACGRSSRETEGCVECDKSKIIKQPRSVVEHEQTMIPPIVHDVLNTSGRPLDPDTRGFMESRFGHDFSQVRVHTDVRAAESARAVDAVAYTVGRDIVFAAGRYQAGAAAGNRLLAHELTHVVQQARSPISLDAMSLNGVTSAHHPSEREADAVADRIAAGHHVAVPSGHAPASVQRLQEEDKGTAQTDDCSGWENDPESFSIHVARHIAKTEINPILGRDLPTVTCRDPHDCDVIFTKGPTIRVMWNPGTRRALGRFDSGGERKRFLFTYSCPDGQLALKFVLSRTDPAPPSATGKE
jgi:hypothetical protein